jgi:hypothetical protein
MNGADGSIDLPFRDIQTALNAATNYSVILVKSGTYLGTSNRNLSFGGKRMVLISEKGWEQTTISVGATFANAFVFNSTNEDYRAQVIGFTITSANAAGMSFSGGSAPTFVNCDITQTAHGVAATNANPIFLNCRFHENNLFDGFAGGNGSAVIASGSNTLIRFSHCLFYNNARSTNSGQMCVTNGAKVTLNNTIVWDPNSLTNLGPTIVTNGGTVAATHSDVRGGYSGTGNINSDPLFDNTLRLTPNSPCIDQGVSDSFPGFSLFTHYDMDGEVRLDHADFANAYSTADIGADEFVYRLQFPIVSNYSEVAEASGVAYLGTNSIGAAIAIVDDEARTNFHTYQLNSNATAIVGSFPNGITEGASADEIHDLEGVTFDSNSNRLYLITSQTKRNRYRDVDNIDTDPVIDPPSNDYDRRRTKIVRVQAFSTLTNMTPLKVFYASESNSVPASVGYDATNGLAALLKTTFAANPALGDKTVTNRVLIARNTANKFGLPVNGVSYATGAALPYRDGGPSTTAGVSLGEFSGTTGLLTNNGLTSNTWYFYKVWAIDANTNYSPGIVASNKTDGVPKLFINEFYASGTDTNTDPDWLEIYNPAHVPVGVGGLEISDDSGQFKPLPSGTNTPPRGFLRFLANDHALGGLNLPFKLGNGDAITVRRISDQARVDSYTFNNNQSVNVTEGRVWDAGPRGFVADNQNCRGAKFQTNSSFPPTTLGIANAPSSNHTNSFKHFLATADVRGTNIYLEWADAGALPPVWRYSPKQYDFHAMNIEDIAFRSTNEMILGLRAPLSNRTNGNSYYVLVTNVLAFASGTSGTVNWSGNPPGIAGIFEMNLDGLGIRSIKWCPNGLTNAQGQAVQRYLILAGNANGGPLVRESLKQKFSVYSWTGSTNAAPVKLIDDLNGHAVRPEGIDIMNVNGEWRVLFVEDRFLGTGYATRNAIHWPVTLLGTVP